MSIKIFSAILAVLLVTAGCTGSDNTNNPAREMYRNEKKILLSDSTKNNDRVASKTAADPAKEWLKTIFRCEDGKSGKYCYYLDKEEIICTARFTEFLQDANEIYGPSNLTDAELPEAEARYKAKWKNIYPLYTQEMWLFGRGNDDALRINSVLIKKLDTNKYSIFIDFGDNIKTQNEVQLVIEENNYKIDYCKTSYAQ
ncbi:hypothetical protein [Sphingobacterium sp. DR205]|uniref:hypothetical protein n=1 Tax=Sphingobacterium sp. DR205 TaxID=2713573 RepID=UPI0013E46727|nr:hypothetical protein [Sphingobacterium sp. DR205]QIH33755.1 hypothetical protein G6053_13050 [Sphingobacterium sp. DR205]